MPLSKAAKNLGVGKSVLKKKCRAFGISVWPFRKINSINKLINVLEVNDKCSIIVKLLTYYCSIPFVNLVILKSPESYKNDIIYMIFVNKFCRER